MKEKLAGLGAVVSALFASVCCIGPLVLVALGVGGIGLAASFTPYRPFFIGITFVFLGVAFYFTYRKREVQCADGTCEIRSGNRKTKILLWLVTAVAIGLSSSHLWIGAFSAGPATVSSGQVVKLNVTGMHCDACAVSVEQALKKVPGVYSARVDFDRSEAEVSVDLDSVDSDALLKVVTEVGYKASVKNEVAVGTSLNGTPPAQIRTGAIDASGSCLK